MKRFRPLGHKSRDIVLFLGDIWKPKTQWASRHLWMPLKGGDGKLRLPAPRPFTLDVTTDEATFLAQPR